MDKAQEFLVEVAVVYTDTFTLRRMARSGCQFRNAADYKVECLAPTPA